MAASAKPQRGSSQHKEPEQGKAKGSQGRESGQQGGGVDWMQEFLHGQGMEVYPLLLPESVEGLHYEEVRTKPLAYRYSGSTTKR